MDPRFFQWSAQIGICNLQILSQVGNENSNLFPNLNNKHFASLRGVS